MLVGVSANSYNGARTISSVTFTPNAGTAVPLSEVGSVENEAGRLAAIYSLVDPPSGVAGTVTVTFSGSVANGMAAGAANFSGVNPADPLDDFVSAVGTEANAINVDVPTDPNDLVFDTIFLGAATLPSLSIGAGQSQLWNTSLDRARGAASTEQAAGATTAMSWTASGGSTAYFWAIVAVPINPAPAGATYDLTIATAGTGSGTVDPDVGVHSYAEGEVVNLQATADGGSTFDGWSGDADCEDGSVTMDADKSCTATFSTSGVGVFLDGAVSSGTADGVNSVTFAHTTGTGVNRLMLVGVASNSYNSAQTISSVTFTPNAGTAVPLTEVGTIENEAGRLAAIYSLADPPNGVAGTVTVTYSGSVGYGIVAGAANFSGVNPADPLDDFVSAVGTEANAINVDVPTDPNDLVFDTIFLGAATPPSLSIGAGQSQLWNASLDRTRGAASIEQAAGATTAMGWTASGGSTAYYWAIGAVPINPAPAGTTYELTVAVDPVGGGTTSPTPGTHSYVEDEIVNVTATPAAGYTFDQWSGACTGSGTCEVTMDADKSVTAHFTAVTYDLTVAVDPPGGGTTDPAAGTHNYADGIVVPITATPASGYVFDHWTGDVANPNAAVTTVTMDASKSITAQFAQTPTGAVTYIGDIGNASSNTTGTSLIITTNAAVAAGDDIIIAFATYGDPNYEISVSDDAGNTYEEAAQAICYQHGRTYIFAAYNVNALPSGGQITITHTSVGVRAAVASVFRGLADTEVLDQSLGYPTDTAASGTLPSVGPTGTTTQADELVIGAIGTEGPQSDAPGIWGYLFSAGPRAGTTGGDENSNWTVSMGWRVVSATGEYTAEKSGITDRYWAAAIATFKAALPNVAPEVSDIPDQTIAEGTSFTTINLDNYVSDVDNTDAEMTWSASGSTELSVSIVNRVATITIPDADWNGSETITFRATDPGTLYDEDAATFTVTAINDAPVVSDIPDQTVAEDTSFTTINLDDYVSDVDNTDAEMTWSASGATDLSVSIVNRVATITIPDANWNGAETITFRATDPGTLYDEDAATFTVTAVNDAPQAADDTYTAIEDTVLNISAPGVLGNDSDIDGDPMTAVKLSDPSHGAVTLNADGSFSYTPAALYNGPDSFTYQASDGTLGSNPATVHINVGAVNNAPVCTAASLTTAEDTAGEVAPACTDADGDTLSYSIVAQPSHGVAAVVAGMLRYTPSANYNGADSFTYKANDGTLDSNVAAVSVTVTPVNDAPVLAAIGDKAVNELVLLSFSAQATDADGDVLTFTLDSGAPAGASIQPASGLFTWTPTEAQGPGSYPVTIRVSDGRPATSRRSPSR